jgi:predicted 3-demethylubiquinone-9 3-methyltransferase (glyoxalase superfamily)
MVRWQCRRSHSIFTLLFLKMQTRQPAPFTGWTNNNRFTFQLHGQDFMVLNGGPMFKFTPAISFFVNCETQEEVDDLWYKLIADGGVEERCGWLKDKFGLSWQIIPSALGKLMGDKDPQKAKRVMDAMLTMNKIDIQKLQDAYDAAV